MGEITGIFSAGPASRQVAGADSVSLLRRVVEGLPLMRPGRFTVYLGRPDPAAVRAELEDETRLIRSARRAVVATPDTTPLAPEAERREPGLGWLANLWFTAVLGDTAAMALIFDVRDPDQGWLLTGPDDVRRFIASVEGELARPDPQLLAV
jgi:hypothetical protein